MTQQRIGRIVGLLCATQMFLLPSGTLHAEAREAPHEVTCEAKLVGIQEFADRTERALRTKENELALCRQPSREQIQNATALRALEGSIDGLLVRIEMHLQQFDRSR